MIPFQIQTRSALFGAAVVLMVGVLSAQSIVRQLVDVRVMEAPVIETQATSWPPRPENLFLENFHVPGGAPGQMHDVYTVPADKTLVVQAVIQFGTGGGGLPGNNTTLRYKRPSDAGYQKPLWGIHQSPADLGGDILDQLGPHGKTLPPGTVLAILNPYGEPEAEVYGYLVDA